MAAILSGPQYVNIHNSASLAHQCMLCKIIAKNAWHISFFLLFFFFYIFKARNVWNDISELIEAEYRIYASVD